MAFDDKNFSLVNFAGGVIAGQVFMYTGTDAAAAVAAADFFATAKDKSARPGDILISREFTDPTDPTTFVGSTIHSFTAVNDVTGAGTVSAGTAIG